MPSEPKTKPTDASVEAFLDAVENPVRREDGKVIAKLLAEVTGEKPVLWGGSIIGYGSYKGPTGDWPIVGFSPRKANMVLYVLSGVAEELDPAASGHWPRRDRTGRSWGFPGFIVVREGGRASVGRDKRILRCFRSIGRALGGGVLAFA